MKKTIDDFKVGDLIYAYRAGMHRVVEIIPPKPSPTHWDPDYVWPAQIVYTIAYNVNGIPKKSRTQQQCAIDYCSKVTTETVDAAIKKLEEIIANFRTLREQLI